MSKALVVLSGGQDSTTCLYWARQRYDEVHAVTFDYNQRHRREIDAAQTVAQMAGIASHEIIILGPVLKGTSPLTNSDQQLETYASSQEMEKVIGNRIELTFVPMRNDLFLCVASNRAICLDIDDLITGVCEADHENYPDCRKVFIQAREALTSLAVEGGAIAPRIVTPLLHLPKWDSIRLALTLPGCYTALGYSHTAYDGGYPPVGRDHASTLRAYGFERAGIPDPLVVRAVWEGAMDWPSSASYTAHMPALVATRVLSDLETYLRDRV